MIGYHYQKLILRLFQCGLLSFYEFLPTGQVIQCFLATDTAHGNNKCNSHSREIDLHFLTQSRLDLPPGSICDEMKQYTLLHAVQSEII